MMPRKSSFSWKSIVVPLESTLCVLTPKHCMVVIGMNTRRAAARRLDEKIDNVGVPPYGNQDPLVEEVANDDLASTNPTALSDTDIRAAFLQIAQSITTQA